MDWYLVMKFLHVTASIIWLGGALIMVILGARAARTGTDAELVATVRQVAWAAERVYVPASVLTLVFGATAVWLGQSWSSLWVILGLVGFAVTLALGVGVLTPRAKKVEAGMAQGGVTPQVVATSRELLTVAKFDMVLLFTIVADMVLKPEPGDWGVLLAMAAAVILGAVFFLGRLVRPKPLPA